jgi:nicotinamidase-related amidase
MKTALLLIDIQEGLDEPGFYGEERNNLHAEENCEKALKLFRLKKWAIFHIKHNSTNPDSPLFLGKSGNNIKDLVAPHNGEILYEKSVNSAFIGTPLELSLKAEGVERVVIVGLTLEHCISTSVRMAANLGFKTRSAVERVEMSDKMAYESTDLGFSINVLKGDNYIMSPFLGFKVRTNSNYTSNRYRSGPTNSFDKKNYSGSIFTLTINYDIYLGNLSNKDLGGNYRLGIIWQEWSNVR